MITLTPRHRFRPSDRLIFKVRDLLRSIHFKLYPLDLYYQEKHLFCAKFAVLSALCFETHHPFLHPRKPTSPPVNYTYWRPDLKVVQRFCRSRTSVPRTFSTRGGRSYNAYITLLASLAVVDASLVTPSVRHTHGANLPLFASTLVSSVNVFRIISNKRQ